MPSNASLAGVITLGVGSAFLYGGITGKSPVTLVHAAVLGKNPNTVAASESVPGLSGSAPTQGIGGGVIAEFGGDAPVTGSGPAKSQVLTAFKTWGFSRAGIAGAGGNIQEESGFNPTSGNPAEGAIGLAQWELGRRTALQRYAAAHGGTETDLAMQLGYMKHELDTFYADVYAYMRVASDPASAAAYWDANYEHSAGTTRQARINYAEQIYQELEATA